MSRAWKPEEDAFLASFIPGHTEKETLDAFEERYGERLTLPQLCNRRAKLGVKHGTNGGRFKKGRASWNKGRKQSEFMSPEGIERSKATRFQKGSVPHNAKGKHVGYERVNRDGYVEVKVKGGLQREANENFRFKHHLVWEEANGRPVPKGHMVVFADHDKRNFDPGNLVLVPRRAWALIAHAGSPYWDRESLEACMALAELRSGIGRAERRPRECSACGSEFVPKHKNQKRCRECIDAGRKGRRP